jgi:hypothetical protein
MTRNAVAMELRLLNQSREEQRSYPPMIGAKGARKRRGKPVRSTYISDLIYMSEGI